MKDHISLRNDADYRLLAHLKQLDDLTPIGVHELSILLGYSVAIIQQRRIPLPKRIEGMRRLRWLLGDVRAFLSTNAGRETIQQKLGRPTKRQQVEARKSAAGNLPGSPAPRTQITPEPGWQDQVVHP
jgi:hypothetical protein